MHNSHLLVGGQGYCECGKKLKFLTQEDADAYIEANKWRVDFKGSHRCVSGQNYWHVTTHINNANQRFSLLEKELHEEMANNAKTIRQRILDYMWDSYQRNKTTKFSSSMVVFAVQQEYPQAKKPNIMQEISKAKKDGLIVSLKEPVPDQRGAVYFTLSRILEEETNPNVTETEVPKQTVKPIPTNPFDKVYEKLDGIKEALDSSEVNLDDDAFDKLASELESKLVDKFGAIIGRLEAIERRVSDHVTVDGDKLADVINARLQNLKLEDSFVYTIREEVDNVTETRIGGYTDLILERLQNLAELKGIPSSVNDADDYKRGIKDGIRLAVEMGIKLDG